MQKHIKTTDTAATTKKPLVQLTTADLKAVTGGDGRAYRGKTFPKVEI